MKTIISKIVVVVIILASGKAFPQGFVNLNFEAANPSGYSPGAGNLPTSVALPGWTAYYSTSTVTNQANVVWYDTVSVGGAFIALTDTNSTGLSPLQGAYSLLLEGSGFSTPTAASIGQTGQIPTNAVSLFFYLSLDSNIQVTFDHQLIPLIQTSSTANYVVMAGDISAYAGQTGELLFSALPNVGYGLIDNIQFSSTPVPEPSTLALALLGSALVVCRRLSKK